MNQPASNFHQATRRSIPEYRILYKHGCENLKSYIWIFYGEDTYRYFCRCEDLRIKMTTLHRPITFLVRCKDQNTITWILQFKHHIRPDASSRICRRNSLFMLCEHIRHTRRELDTVSRICWNYTCAWTVSCRLMTKVWSIIPWPKMFHRCYWWKTRQCRKFQRLHKTENPHPPPLTWRRLANLSNVSLDDAEFSALSRVINWSMTPTMMTIENIQYGM